MNESQPCKTNFEPDQPDRFRTECLQTQQHAYLRSEQSARQARGAMNTLRPQLSHAESERPTVSMDEEAKDKMDDSRDTANEYEEQIAELKAT